MCVWGGRQEGGDGVLQAEVACTKVQGHKDLGIFQKPVETIRLEMSKDGSR